MLGCEYSLPERALGFWASLTLGILAVTSLGLRYVTPPISCWCPREFTSSMVKYVHDVCFQRTEVFVAYFLEMPDTQPSPEAKAQNTYHQWVPFALGIAAILCLVPHCLWRMLSGFLWLDTHALAMTLADNQRHNAAGRHVMVRDSALMLLAGLKGGNLGLTAAAMGRKVVGVVMGVLQMILIVALFHPRLSVAGDDKDDGEKKGMGNEMMEDEENKEEKIDYNASVPLPGHFLCDVTIQHLQNAARYTFQCYLPLSQVYSQAFTFLFYLLLLLTLCCLLDLMLSLGRHLIPALANARLLRYLAVSDPDLQRSPVVQRFLDSLGVDGRLVVGVVAEACGPVAAADLTNHLWMTFKASSRPGAVMAGTTPDSGSLVTTIPPSSSAPPPPFAASAAGMGVGRSGDGEALPLIAMGGKGEGGSGAQA